METPHFVVKKPVPLKALLVTLVTVLPPVGTGTCRADYNIGVFGSEQPNICGAC